MNKFMNLIKIILFFCLILLNGCLYSQQEVRPRIQPTVPKGWTEEPYIENAPKPVVTLADQKRGFIIFSRPAIEPVYKNTHPLPHERTQILKAFATPGEFEPLTLSLYPLKNLKNLRLTISDLTHDKYKIDSSNLDLRLVTYWNVPYPYWISKGTYRNVPELLEKVSVNEAKKFECQRYWIIVHVPEGAAEGIYEGHVNISHDKLNKPVHITIKFRVLGFKLQKDPHKRHSVFYLTMFSGTDRLYRKMSGELYERAVSNDIQAMLDYGLDMIPSLYVLSDGDHVIFSKKNQEILEKMLNRGLRGPIPIDGEAVIVSLLQKYEGMSWKSHWKLKNLPSAKFFNKITKAFMEFKSWWFTKGWPEFYLCPVDEVDPTAREFGVRVYKAIKKAGIKTFITKESTSNDALYYKNYIDAWCSQPFDVSYKTATVGDYEYWSYPNYNSGEIKNRLIMMKGGRMTFGFGFWRSGYTVLIPWHWRMSSYQYGFDYLRSPSAPCGMQMDEHGTIIPAIYWDSFREGIDDLKYIYTLEKAIEERRGLEECGQLVDHAEKELQNIWKYIHVQRRYQKSNIWSSDEFNIIRKVIAQNISRLLEYPSARNMSPKSVSKSIKQQNLPTKDNSFNITEKTFPNDHVDIFNLKDRDFFRWKSQIREGVIRIVNRMNSDKILKYIIHIDHRINNKTDGIHPIGWPGVGIRFRKGELDLTTYDYLYFRMKLNWVGYNGVLSSIPLKIYFKSRQGKIEAVVSQDLIKERGKWFTFFISIPDLLQSSFYDSVFWKDLQNINLVIPERWYNDGTKLIMELDEAYLLKFKRPFLKEIGIPEYADISQGWMTINLCGYGFSIAREEKDKIQFYLKNMSGKIISYREASFQTRQPVIMDISKVENPGDYYLVIQILDKDGKIILKKNKTIKMVDFKI